jgi:purine-binding chemotaxis protein CheW
MEHKSYLIFKLNQYRYGLETSVVQEIFFLPELTPVQEAPPDIVGVLNLRGNILPVMDLSLRFGHRSIQYQITDSTIVIEWQGFSVGIIVNTVEEVKEIETATIQAQISYGRKITTEGHHFVAGFAKLNTDIVTLLDPQHLIEYSEVVNPLIPFQDKQNRSLSRRLAHDPELADPVNPEAETTDFPGASDQGMGAMLAPSREKSTPLTDRRDRVDGDVQEYFCPQATPEERAIFRERAANLILASDRQDITGLMSLAVVMLNGEYFGLDLSLVREFTDIRQITPVPCCGDFILGNMNLRGEIVTLVDIRQLLNLSGDGVNDVAKAMVVHLKDIVAGITIDEVCDVIYLQPSEIKAAPTSGHSGNNEYLRGTAPYRDKILGLIDFHKIITEQELVVNQEG